MAEKKYLLQTSPFIVPTIDGKLIEEHFGIASLNGDGFSLAHMVAPAGWSEPFQTPEFDETTLVYSGKKMVEIDDEKITLIEGNSILVKKGTRVRYSNPFEKECRYISVCIPAFSIDKVKRE